MRRRFQISNNDFELGTVLIKPGASWFKTTIPIYEHAVDVRSDFSDLEETVGDLLADPEALQRRGDDIRNLAANKYDWWKKNSVQNFKIRVFI